MPAYGIAAPFYLGPPCRRTDWVGLALFRYVDRDVVIQVGAFNELVRPCAGDRAFAFCACKSARATGENCNLSLESGCCAFHSRLSLGLEPENRTITECEVVIDRESACSVQVVSLTDEIAGTYLVRKQSKTSEFNQRHPVTRRVRDVLELHKR